MADNGLMMRFVILVAIRKLKQEKFYLLTYNY